MMKYSTIFAIFFASCILRVTTAANASSRTSQGFKLNDRVKKAVRKLSDTEATTVQDYDLLRQWKEEDYEELMNVMMPSVRGGNLRYRQLQRSNNGGYVKKQRYFTMEQPRVSRWQKVALATIITAIIALAWYICALKRELSHLNQYMPLGYKLFPESTEASEEVRPADGVEMN